MRVIKALGVVAPVAVVAAAMGSVGLTYRGDQFNETPRLFAMFACWVLSPFVALMFAHVASKRWSPLPRATLHGVSLILSVGSLVIYGNEAWKPQEATATPFLLVPPASWLLMSIVIPIAALKSTGPSRRKPVIWLMKAIAAAGMLSVVGIALFMGLLLFDHNWDTTLPALTGPFAVGRTTYVWTDATNEDPMAPQPGTNRELVAWVWYPARRGQPPQALDDYFPAPWRTAVERQWGMWRFLSRDLSRVRVHSLRDADLSPQQHSYPVALMTGGPSFTNLAEELTSHGYVVVSFDAAYRTSDVVFPDGRVIARLPQNNLDLVSGSEFEALANRLTQSGSADMSFALNELEGLNASDPSGKFKGKLDLQRVGAFGHSLRGAVALQFCHDDARCKACIDVDGLPLGSAAREGITQPLLFLMSDHRGDSDDEESGVARANFGSIFDRLSPDRWSEITIRGASHYMFSDDAVLKSPLMMRALRRLGLVGIDGRRQLAVANHYISTFFHVYLEGAPASELGSRAEYPEVEYTH
jgi:hypothetical protein